MTICNITVTADGKRALVTTDSGAAPSSGLGAAPVSENPANAWRAANTGGGSVARPTLLMNKLIVFAHLRCVVAIAGEIGPLLQYLGCVGPVPLGVRNIRDMIAEQRPRMQEIASRHAGLEFAVAMLGIVPGGVEGYLWSSTQDFEPIDLAGRSWCMPAVDFNVPANAGLEAEWLGSAESPDPEPFHRRMLAAQLAAYHAGAYPADFCAGAPFTIARLDAGGIHIETIDEAALARGAGA